MIAYQYTLLAAEGRAEELQAALQALARALRSIGSCHGVALYRDQANPGRFIFREKWESIEAHDAGAADIDQATMAAVFGAVAGKPERLILDALDA